MINFFIYIFIFSGFIFSQDQIGIGLFEEELISYLQDNYTTPYTQGYDNARDILYGEIENNNGLVYGIYTDYSVELDGSDPSTNLYNNGMNCEHLWPQSLGSANDPMKSDMHHLRPCKDNVNTSRGNKPFDEINDNITATWFWLEYSSSNIPSNNINEYSESASYAFEPREEVKGDVARAIFYFYTIYENIADDDFFNTQKEILYEWHIQDPIEESEISRTWAIASYQYNIPNPFILDDTLIYRAYFYDGNNDNVGDVTQDGTVNVVDVVLIVNYIIGTQTLNNIQLQIADINIDGLVNIVDIVALINIIIGD